MSGRGPVVLRVQTRPGVDFEELGVVRGSEWEHQKVRRLLRSLIGARSSSPDLWPIARLGPRIASREGHRHGHEDVPGIRQFHIR